MGDIKKKKKKFRRPKKLFEKDRIEAEDKIVFEYGLKNKREIWKADSVVSKMRRRAKSLIPATEEERQEFFNKLRGLGLKIENTADVLALTEKDILNRRLQTIVFKKNLAKTPKESRQLITHKKIAIDGKINNRPSIFVDSESENKITLVNGGKNE